MFSVLTKRPEDSRDRLCLSPRIVEVVSCRLDLTRGEIDGLRVLLSPAERERADRLRSDRARDAFVVARGRLRQVLGLLSGRPPGAVQIAVDARGKPRLEDDGCDRLRLNLAHAADLMLCAMTLDHEVGIDVERVRDDVDIEDIARRFFAPDEARRLLALPSVVRRDAFFACWTRKEAVVKATGEGLARTLDSFVVTVDPDRAEMLSADPELGPPWEWSLLPVPLPPTYQGTVALRAKGVSLRSWMWPDPGRS